jgi:pilus assembly protein Flp/PilA
MGPSRGMRRIARLPKGSDMRKISQWVGEFLTREDGPTAVEYAVMLALIIVVCITAITTLGKNANNTFTTVGNAVGSTGS